MYRPASPHAHVLTTRGAAAISSLGPWRWLVGHILMLLHRGLRVASGNVSVKAT